MLQVMSPKIQGPWWSKSPWGQSLAVVHREVKVTVCGGQGPLVLEEKWMHLVNPVVSSLPIVKSFMSLPVTIERKKITCSGHSAPWLLMLWLYGHKNNLKLSRDWILIIFSSILEHWNNNTYTKVNSFSIKIFGKII